MVGAILFQNFQPPAQDPAILSYQHFPTMSNSNTVTNSPLILTSTGSGPRETGIVEKLLVSAQQSCLPLIGTLVFLVHI
jgi:hypothetical protein